MHHSSHPAGLLHASSCSPDLQVSLRLIFFSASLMVVRRNHRPSPCLFSPSCGILSKLRRMEPGATATRYGQLLDCVCSWGQAADVIELITDWLAEALPKRGVSLADTLTSGVEAECIHVVLYLSHSRRKGAAAGRCVSRRRWRPNQSWLWFTWSTCLTTRPRGRKSWLLGRDL